LYLLQQVKIHFDLKMNGFFKQVVSIYKLLQLDLNPNLYLVVTISDPDLANWIRISNVAWKSVQSEGTKLTLPI
jgi:cell division FtsZ-interacting protein ZapD